MNELRCDVPPCIVIATCESVRISSTFPLSVEVMNVTSVPPSPVPPSPGPPLVEMPLHGLRDHHRTSPQLPCRGACHEHRRVELAEQLSHLFSGHSLIGAPSDTLRAALLLSLLTLFLHLPPPICICRICRALSLPRPICHALVGRGLNLLDPV